MFIQQFKYSTDNLGYLVYAGNQGAAIDAGAVEDILSFAQLNNIHIKYVTNTHSHSDHMPGNQALLSKTDAQFIDCTTITSDQSIVLDDEVLQIIHTPGHTNDSVTFVSQDFLVTGDTLFNGTVGNCFSGDLKAFFNSLNRLMAMPKEIKIYGGHDYVLESLQIAKTIEKENPDIDPYIKKYNPKLIVSTLADELKVNPYIRFNTDSIIKILQEKNMPTDTAFARFNSMMEIF